MKDLAILNYIVVPAGLVLKRTRHQTVLSSTSELEGGGGDCDFVENTCSVLDVLQRLCLDSVPY